MPTAVPKTAASEPAAACIAQGADSPVGLWCIGHMAPAPCPHVHSAACGSAAVIHKATGTSAIVPTWQHSQIAATGASTRRRGAISITPYRPDAEPVKPRTSRVPLATFSRRPGALVYQEVVESLSDALKRESQIKNWSRAWKDALIAGDPVPGQ
jgi:hypothetical protein